MTSSPTSPDRAAAPAHGPADAEAVRAHLTRRAEELGARAAALGARANRLSLARLAVFAVALVVGIVLLRDHGELAALALVPVAAFGLLVVLHHRAEGASTRAGRLSRAVADDLARLEGEWPQGAPTGIGLVPADDVGARDLDLVGTTSLFARLCRARTPLGQATLARWLLAPDGADTIRARQQAVAELAPREDLRDAHALLGDPGELGLDRERLLAWAAAAPPPMTLVHRLTADLLGLAALVTATGWALGSWPLGFLAGVVALELVFDQLLKGRRLRLLGDVLPLGPSLPILSGLLGRVAAESWSCERLATLATSLSHEGAPAALEHLERHVQGHENDRLNSVTSGLVFLLQRGVRRTHAIDRWRREHGASLPAWLDAAGEVEALLSLSAHAAQHPGDPFPTLTDEVCLHAEGLGHPLLDESVCVRNDVRLDGGLRLLLVSGSNMSGKSTLLRAVGSNLALARAGAPVRARSLTTAPFVLGASLAVSDSLQDGVSRFYAEVARLAQVDALLDGADPVLFLLDEILAGTNSSDRLVGASAVVRRLVERGALGLVTTHDLALTRLVDDLGEVARNVHFEDTVRDDTLSFDYRLRDGVVQRGNALVLMRSLGLRV